MKKHMLELSFKVLTAVVVSVLSGYLYEQARKVGKKSDFLVRQIQQWDERNH